MKRKLEKKIIRILYKLALKHYKFFIALRSELIGKDIDIGNRLDEKTIDEWR